MSITQIIFYLFSFTAILASCFVVTVKNPVKAALFLVLAFITMAGNWIILEAEFLAAILILVYVGAVMVLFLFVVMMLNLQEERTKKAFTKFYPLGILIAIALIAIIAVKLLAAKFNILDYQVVKHSADYSNIKALGFTLYSDFILPFEIAGVILLVAMIGAIGLAFRGRRSKFQVASKQTSVTKKDRLKIVG